MKAATSKEPVKGDTMGDVAADGVQEITIRFSELQTLMRCALQHRVIWAGDLQPPGTKEPLLRGSAFHAMMDGHYSTLKRMDEAGVARTIQDAYEGAYARLRRWQEEEAEGKLTDEIMDQLVWMYGSPGEGYIGKYGVDPDLVKIYAVEDHRKVLLWEGEVGGQKWRVWLRTTADLVAKSKWLQGRVYLIDHKTAKGRDVSKEAFAKENQLDPQRGIYTASLKLKKDARAAEDDTIPETLPIWAALHNSIRVDKLQRKMSLEERFARHPVYYKDLALHAVWEDMQAVAVSALEIRMGGGIRWSSPDPMTCKMFCGLKEPHLISMSTGRPIMEIAREFGWKTSAEKLAAGELVDPDGDASGLWENGGF